MLRDIALRADKRNVVFLLLLISIAVIERALRREPRPFKLPENTGSPSSGLLSLARAVEGQDIDGRFSAPVSRLARVGPKDPDHTEEEPGGAVHPVSRPTR